MTRRVAIIGTSAIPVGRHQTKAEEPLQVLEQEIMTKLVVEAVADACRDVARIPTQVSGHDRFGRRKDVSVATLQRTPELLGLHLRLVDALPEPLGPGAVFAGDSRHVREGYRPHVTARHGEILPIGASVVLDHDAIVDRRPNARSGMRRVIEVIEL